MIPLTTHTIIKNEENWVWFALSSVKDFATTMLVFDDGSTDKTLEVVKNIHSPKLKIESRALATAQEHTKIRNRMLDQTETDWFLLLDGDEIWNKTTVKKLLIFLEDLDDSVYAVVMRTRNCVGDVFHYSPESAGRYHLLGRTGHLTVRAYRKLPGFHWEGVYPLEVYVDAQGHPINDQPNHLAFFDRFYWHATHLRRSADRSNIKGHRRQRFEIGLKVDDRAQLPEVFFAPRPAIVSDPLIHRGIGYEIASRLAAPVKSLKRRLQKI